ncbi:C3HC4 type (RING finger) zinc finger protein [Phytophthora infestans]|uniref:E3 ubiquitin protein ligase n=1 Tax=Phytophthora infestans TaxID=4787 RepID=A0A833T0N5_PHYIN|nr:C3HC4 type (RING finger) zinc finger protein [Phytophthora infestans]KAF4135205.1 C3HC4 type zinc finger [Phytophthora infestans]
MAETGAHARENGVSHKKRRETMSGGESAPKKIKLEEDTPPEANPNTIEAVREKNKALDIDMKEKNRRITYLTKKCEALYRSRGVTSASFRFLRRQWFQLQDELLAAVKTVDPSSVPDEASKEAWLAALDAIDGFGQVRVRTEELKLNLPEWFITVAKDAEQEEPDADVSLPSDDDADASAFIKADDLSKLEKEVYEQLKQKSEITKELLQKLLAAVGSASQDKTKPIEYAHILQEKRAAVAETLGLKSQLQAFKTRIAELERDVEAKETERHRACRDYDRLSVYVEQRGGVNTDNGDVGDVKMEEAADGEKAGEKASSGSSSTEMVKQEALVEQAKEHAKVVATLKENIGILSKKLYQERHNVDSMKRELEKLKASETAWKNDEAALAQEHEEKIQQLRDEKAHGDEEYKKVLHKTKDLEHHMTMKWEKKITKIQAEMSKTKAQMDELNLKNVSLREKISNASTYRDQLSEAKSELQSVRRENTNLTAQIERERSRADRAQASADNHEILTLTKKVALLEKEKLELQQTYDALKQAEMKSAGEKLTDALKRLSGVEAKLEEERKEAHECSERLRAQIKDMKASGEATREENDALLLEIETVTKDVESLRHGRKKFIQQIEEKRNANKKLHTLLAREEQAKSHCFEELAAVRLQVSSLSTVHKHQKAFIESAKESLQAKEIELDKLKEYVKTIETEREASDAEKRKLLRDAEVAKTICATAEKSHQQLQQEKQKPCEECETQRKKIDEMERKLQHAKSTPSTGELTDLERFELRDLQKLVNCSVCQDRRKDVLISKCSHMFCKECIENNLKSRNRKCPTCKKMFGHDDVKSVWFT